MLNKYAIGKTKFITMRHSCEDETVVYYLNVEKLKQKNFDIDNSFCFELKGSFSETGPRFDISNSAEYLSRSIKDFLIQCSVLDIKNILSTKIIVSCWRQHQGGPKSIVYDNSWELACTVAVFSAIFNIPIRQDIVFSGAILRDGELLKINKVSSIFKKFRHLLFDSNSYSSFIAPYNTEIEGISKFHLFGNSKKIDFVLCSHAIVAFLYVVPPQRIKTITSLFKRSFLDKIENKYFVDKIDIGVSRASRKQINIKFYDKREKISEKIFNAIACVISLLLITIALSQNYGYNAMEKALKWMESENNFNGEECCMPKPDVSENIYKIIYRKAGYNIPKDIDKVDGELEENQPTLLDYKLSRYPLSGIPGEFTFKGKIVPVDELVRLITTNEAQQFLNNKINFDKDDVSGFAVVLPTNDPILVSVGPVTDNLTYLLRRCAIRKISSYLKDIRYTGKIFDIQDRKYEFQRILGQEPIRVIAKISEDISGRTIISSFTSTSGEIRKHYAYKYRPGDIFVTIYENKIFFDEIFYGILVSSAIGILPPFGDYNIIFKNFKFFTQEIKYAQDTDLSYVIPEPRSPIETIFVKNGPGYYQIFYPVQKSFAAGVISDKGFHGYWIGYIMKDGKGTITKQYIEIQKIPTTFIGLLIMNITQD